MVPQDRIQVLESQTGFIRPSHQCLEQIIYLVVFLEHALLTIDLQHSFQIDAILEKTHQRSYILLIRLSVQLLLLTVRQRCMTLRLPFEVAFTGTRTFFRRVEGLTG